MAKKEKMPQFSNDENCPPQQEKGLNAGDDNWGIHGTSLAVDNAKIASGRVNSEIGGSLSGNYMRPVYDDAHDSAYIQDSHSDSQKKE
jgi:hypothetical protein